MSTNTNKYGIPIRAGWAWVLPSSAMDAPAIQVEVWNETTQVNDIVVLSIRDYLNTAEANVGLFQNRKIIPLKGGTHSAAFFDSDIDDINGFVAHLDGQGLINGGRDFTLIDPLLYYSMPITKYDEFIIESPLNVEVVV